MGCDIHMYIEKRVNGKWIPAQGFVETGENQIDVPFNDRFTDRDYELFGFLAGVRDYANNQYFPAKGFPADASPEVKTVFDRQGCDAHTPSFITLAELKAVPWDTRLIKISGMFREEQLKEYRKSFDSGKPDFNLITTWCQWTSCKGWVLAEIEVPIKVRFNRFCDLVFSLRSYDYRRSKDEIRIVFWFDN